MVNEFYVQRCIYLDRYIGETYGWQIIGPENTFWINKWLGRLTTNTGKQYAYKVCKFLNFLLKKQIIYMEARDKDLDAFLVSLRFEQDDLFTICNSSSRYTTIRSYVSALTGFYSFVAIVLDSQRLTVQAVKNTNNSHAFLYNIIWEKTRKQLLVDKYISRYKPKKQYVKWYLNKEINTIYANLPKYRDRAIFALTLRGMRIDEVLSLRVYDYSIGDLSVVAYRSKGRQTGETGRAVALDKKTAKAIENYLLYERSIIEIELLEKDQLIDEALFVGLRRGYSYGKVMTYSNFNKILKLAAKKGGLDPKTIRTHSGRSTSVMRDILFHAEHPESLSLHDIQLKYGWNDMSSMNPYLDSSNPQLTLKNRKLIDRVHAEQTALIKKEIGEQQ